MENKITHIIREVPYDGCDFSTYFDDDFIKGCEENSIIYIVQNEGYGRFYGFNDDVYTNGIENYGEVYLGAAKEFCVIELDEDGNEVDKCYGFIVADCEIKDWRTSDAEYKKIVCDWDGIDEQTTRLEMIDGYSTINTANYRVA